MAGLGLLLGLGGDGPVLPAAVGDDVVFVVLVIVVGLGDVAAALDGDDVLVLVAGAAGSAGLGVAAGHQCLPLGGMSAGVAFFGSWVEVTAAVPVERPSPSALS